VTSSREFAIIQGEYGTGKSMHAHKVGALIISEGGIFLMGKFDPMSPRPFSTLVMALEQYCDLLISQIGYGWTKIVTDRVHAVLGKDISHLISLIPKLGFIFTEDVSNVNVATGDNNIYEFQRIQFLLCEFIQVIASSSILSIIICLDDVQWADKASISVINQVIAAMSQ
jgi:predicted ATPase